MEMTNRDDLIYDLYNELVALSPKAVKEVIEALSFHEFLIGCELFEKPETVLDRTKVLFYYSTRYETLTQNEDNKKAIDLYFKVRELTLEMAPFISNAVARVPLTDDLDNQSKIVAEINNSIFNKKNKNFIKAALTFDFFNDFMTYASVHPQIQHRPLHQQFPNYKNAYEALFHEFDQTVFTNDEIVAKSELSDLIMDNKYLTKKRMNIDIKKLVR